MSENVHQSGTHGPALDDELARLEGDFHPEGQTAGSDDRYDGTVDPEEADTTTVPGGTPDGMTRTDIELRTGIAQVLGLDAFPGDRERLLSVAHSNQAPDWVIHRLATLPPSTSFQNVQDVARTLGIGVEVHRN